MTLIPFNINDHIRVKLKQEGLAHWKAEDDKIFCGPLGQYSKPLEDYASKADSDGYTRFQAWEFMRLFGPVLRMGSLPPFDTSILIEHAEPQQ
ncbi:hypothetical protein LJ737_20815 [Hymenobacter sp. 15J16-1T3B]|uniref:hypothetical protein n=1 Tax=Hymenobacter sp. 15J16-1T3B TaxID=2886941 RepID=UPI001D10161B|nr:hypothetical protein [Hymenobacter sp. 15J16-1T3B]MCC3159696.1 hypothetical protein [Hymenobacter sp. 15J16-1T3B]